MWLLLILQIVHFGNLIESAQALRIQPQGFVSSISQLVYDNSTLGIQPSRIDTALGLEYGCSGTQYGWMLDVSSCLDALGRVDRSSAIEKTWGPRHADPKFDIGFPKAYWSGDATCIILPILAPGRFHASASVAEVAAGATALIRGCANKPPSPGGLAKDISPDGGLGVILAKYHPPRVQCYERVGPENIEDSCLDLLDNMDATNMPRVFAAESSPRSPVVRLPRSITSGDRRCYLTIQTTGRSDLESWQRIWEDASIATAVCIRRGLIGEVAGLGKDRRLTVTMSGRELGATASNVTTA